MMESRQVWFDGQVGDIFDNKFEIIPLIFNGQQVIHLATCNAQVWMLLTTGHTAYHILIVLAISYTIVVTVMNAMTELNCRCT